MNKPKWQHRAVSCQVPVGWGWGERWPWGRTDPGCAHRGLWHPVGSSSSSDAAEGDTAGWISGLLKEMKDFSVVCRGQSPALSLMPARKLPLI